MARVVRVDGKSSSATRAWPWLRSSTYGEILQNSNKLYRYSPPIDLLPESARDAGVRWLLGSAYFVIDFRVGEGPPPLNGPADPRQTRRHASDTLLGTRRRDCRSKDDGEAGCPGQRTFAARWLDRAVRSAAKEVGHDSHLRGQAGERQSVG